MKNEKRGFAVASGVALLLYGALLGAAALIFSFLGPFSLGSALAVSYYLLPAIAGIFLIRQECKPAAILMTLTAVAILLLEIPEIPQYLAPEGFLVDTNAATGVSEYLPRSFVALPILQILAVAFFAVGLWLRGWGALVLTALAAGAELASMGLRLASFRYVSGEPTAVDLVFPAFFALGAILAGLYLFSLREKD